MTNSTNSPGKLFLGGGGGAKDSLSLDKKFISSLKKKKVVYIPIALTPKEGGYESCFDWITSTLTPISDDFIEIVMWTNLNNKTLEELRKYDAVYIGGGNTYKLLDHIKTSKFDELLKEFYLQGGHIYGGSAGAIILGKTISIVSEENKANYQNQDGLNLLDNISVLCHFTEEKEASIQRFQKNNKAKVLALTEKSGAIVVDTNQLESVGTEPCRLFSVSGGIESLNSGEKVTI